MSLNATLRSATSGLMAAQIGLRTTSDNVANVNTPGYVRKVVDQQQMVAAGAGTGVNVSAIRRVTDGYLEKAATNATADSSRWGVMSSYLDNAQSLFGDPSTTSGYFSQLDKVWSSFSAAANDPTSSILRAQSIAGVQDFLSETTRINDQIGEITKTVASQTSADVAKANDLLTQIDRLNADISRAKVTSGDPSGSENLQKGLIDQLSTLMNIQVQPISTGGVIVRSAEGYALTGTATGAAKLTFNQTAGAPGYISAMSGDGLGNPQAISITSGEIRGLLDLHDDVLPGITDQLGEFANQVAAQLNAAHNSAARVPPPATMTGRDTGLDLPTAVSNFTGTTTLAITNASGVVQKTIAINFTAGTMSVNGGAGAAFTPANFLANLNAALGASGSATYTNRGLTLNATGGNGLAFDTGTATKAGQGFSQFFGLNDLVKSSGITNFDTGMTTADPHGFTAGQTITLRVAQADGRPIRDMTVTVPAATTMQDLLNSLNANATGVGLFGSFGLDSNGKMSFTSNNALPVTVSVTNDQTTRGAGGPSVSDLFGLGTSAKATRASKLSVNPTIAADPTKLSLNKLDLTVAATQPAIRPGDGSGAQALATAGAVTTHFGAAGTLGNLTTTVNSYASQFGGGIGRTAQTAETQKQASSAVLSEATSRMQSVESVNLDEELVRLTTYQQAFNASARMIQATKELFDVLVNIV